MVIIYKFYSQFRDWMQIQYSIRQKVNIEITIQYKVQRQFKKSKYFVQRV